MIAAIVALDVNFGIGNNGDLLVKLHDDMKRFKELTMNNTVIMGRKTFDSLSTKPLPNRKNIVITNKTSNIHNGIIYMNMDMVQKFLKVKNKEDNIFIIGGGQIYSQLLPFCDHIYLTKIFKAYDNVDTYFPNIYCIPDWKLKSSSNIYEENGIRYRYELYVKNNN